MIGMSRCTGVMVDCDITLGLNQMRNISGCVCEDVSIELTEGDHPPWM